MANNNTPSFLFLVVFFFAFCLAGNGVYAFGAGNIPSFSYIEGRAYRHGDIEDALADLAKKGASGFALSSIIGKSKFGGLDIKRIYFGNWLRDYSQAVDIAGLKKLPLQTIVNLCMALGFLAHGYATHEFEVTPERLACYLPTEHIDNPKGYGDGEDARKYHPGLRGPVDPRELQVDPQTGMKNYIANEHGNWDTSKALVRRTLEKCIHLGRQHRSSGQKADLYESYRLLGTALHTLEDYSAHSNFCELALVAMGHQQVFTHVGDNVRIQAPNGKWVAPIVTGTFGSSDFIHSLLGEAGDKLSEASVSDLNKKMAQARSTQDRGGPSESLRSLFSALPDGAGGDMSREMDGIDRIRAGTAQGGKNPEDMSPQELHAVLWQVLSFRDSVVKKIEKTIEKIPGLGSVIEKIMDSISVFVFTTLEPFLKPILRNATTGLSAASSEVIDSHDQYEVFNDPRASDPTHSFLSKDHFNLILNEPAGLIAKVILIHTVTLVTKAWDDNSVNVRQITDDILQCLFHPDFLNRNSKVQNEMMQCLHKWYSDLGGKQKDIIRRLSKENVRSGNNKRVEGEGGVPEAQGTYAFNQGQAAQTKIQGYVSGIPGVGQFLGGGAGNKRDGEAGGYPSSHGGGQGHGHGAAPAPPPVSGGQADSYYGHGSSQAPPPTSSHNKPPSSSYAPPPGVPQHSGYNPSYSLPAPPSFSGGRSSPTPSFHGGHSSPAPSFHGSHSAAAPAFSGVHSTAAPAFPGGAPSYGEHAHAPSFPGGPAYMPYGGEGGGVGFPDPQTGGGGYGAPGGFNMPSGPGGYAPSGPAGFGGPPPAFPGSGFPDANPYGQHGHGQPPNFPNAYGGGGTGW